MGKKRGRDESTSDHGSGGKKKHKKNKHSHKSKHHRDRTGPPITLKIKLGDKYISTSGEGSFQDDLSSTAETESLSLAEQSVGVAEEWEGSDVSVGKDDYEEPASNEVPNDEEEEEEEEAWLDALESGDVDERGYLPTKKSSTLTARQRAMLGGGERTESPSEILLQLPLAKKVPEEDLLKKMEKNQKRRLAAQRRKEKRKAETVRKLLEKQTVKKKDDDKVPRLVPKHTTPHIRYLTSTRPLVQSDNVAPPVHSLLSLPVGMEYPIAQQVVLSPPPPTLCAVKGCGQVKKYSDSVSHLPLCSLQCYKQLRASGDMPTTSTSLTLTL